MRRVLVALYRAARAVVVEWRKGPERVVDLPEPDRAALERLSPGLRRVVEEVRIVRAALLGEIDTIDASWEIRSFYDQRYERPQDQRDSRTYQAHLASTRAGALVFELLGQVRALSDADRGTVEALGFGHARLDAIAELIATDDAEVAAQTPTSGPLRRAANELTELERALAHPTAADPYR